MGRGDGAARVGLRGDLVISCEVSIGCVVLCSVLHPSKDRVFAVLEMPVDNSGGFANVSYYSSPLSIFITQSRQSTPNNCLNEGRAVYLPHFFHEVKKE